MGAEFLQLVADIFIDILKCVKKGRGNSGGSGAILDSGAKVLFGGVHQSAIGVINDHEFFCAKQMVGDDQGTQSVVGDNAAGVADDVGIALFQSQGASREASIHACEDGQLALRAWCQAAQFMRAGVDFVGGENFVNDAHCLQLRFNRFGEFFVADQALYLFHNLAVLRD
jgi:hypothetical protein